MSLWNSFLDNIAKPAAKAVETGGQFALDFVTQAIPGVPSPSNVYSQIAIDAGANIGLSPMLARFDLEKTAQEAIKQNLTYSVKQQAASNDLTLKIANNIVEPIISEGITRPASTLALITDNTSPLYQPGKYEKGFQANDIRAAYNRSADVSVFQALTKSELNPFAPVGRVILKSGGVDVDTVNLWDDADVKKNFSENIVGRYYTGLGDFVVGNLLIAGAGGALGAAGRVAGRATGFTNKGIALSEFEATVNSGLKYNAGDTTAKFSNAANDFEFMAKNTDINQTIQRLEPYTTNPRMIDAINDATDPEIVKDLILADKGYAPALERLLKTEPALIGDVADVTSTFRAKAMDDGGAYYPEGDALDRINALYDDGIRLPEHKKYYETVMDPENKSFLGGGKDYFPIEPKLGAKQLASLKDRISPIKSGIVTRDFKDIGGFEERILGNKLVTRAIRFTGTYKPLSYVTFSGARPLDGVVELHAFFDDMKLFENGTNRVFITPKESISASEYRNNVVTNFLKANSDIKRKEMLDEFDENLGVHLAYSNGFYDTVAIKKFITELRASISNGHNQFAAKGMGIDAQGRRVTTDPLTQRQLVESVRLSPYNIIEKEIIKAMESKTLKRSATKGSDATSHVFEFFNRYWTLDVLARPSYIPKQSLGEPTLSAFLAQGAGFVVDSIPTFAKNTLKNNRNRALQVASKIHSGPALKEIQTTIDAKSTMLDIAINDLNALNAEAAYFLTDAISPAAKLANGPRVIQALKDANKLVDDIELDLMDAVKPFGDMPPIPTFAGLENRIAYLEKVLRNNNNVKYGSAIANAKSALGSARGEVHNLIPDAAKLLDTNKNIAEQYAVIEKILNDLGGSYVEEAKLLGKSAEYKKRFYGKEDNYRMIDGKWRKIDSFFDENQYGAAMREELANSQTQAMTYMNESSVGTRQSITMRRGPGGVTDVTNPIYFEELAYVANRTMRGDPLIDQILGNVGFDDLVKWGESTSGVSYMEKFGGQTLGSVPDFIRSRVSFVNRYLPNKAAQARVLAGDVTSNELKSLMGNQLNELSAIHPTEFNYHAASQNLIGVKGLDYIDKGMANVARWTFKKLTSPENPIRWAYADKVFLDTLAKKANILAQQGIEVTDKRLNALRQSAGREAVTETEKTFYTIRRQNRALYAMRVATAFPTASLNAFYRYGRFAIKNPTRIAGFLHSYNSMFTSFGIDQYGNPVENPLEATHLVLPGSADLGLYGGKGIRLSARSIGFLLNIPGPSFFTAYSTANIMKWQPKAEDVLKDAMGSNYDIFFPYGPQASFSQAMTPTWAQYLKTYITGDESKKDFLNSVKSVANYYHTLDEMGIQEYPGLDVVRNDARNLYLVKAQWSFASVFGVPIKVDTDPMKLYEDYYGILVNKWKTRGNDNVDSKFLAEQELLATLGADFPLDRITYKGVAAKAYVPATLESYNRVFKDNNDLVPTLAQVDPKLISLLTLDVPSKPEDFNLSIYKILNDPKTKLPGNTQFNDLALTPEQEEAKRQANRAWTDYNEKRDQLTSLALSRGKTSLSAAPDLAEELKRYGTEVLSKQSSVWYDEWKNPKISDNSYVYGKGLDLIVSNPKFMAEHGNSKLWQDVSAFVSQRNIYAMIYQSLPIRDSRKKDIKTFYNKQVLDNLPQWDPALQELIKRYFVDDTMKTTQVEVK